jgi:hypothetical protein
MVAEVFEQSKLSRAIESAVLRTIRAIILGEVMIQRLEFVELSGSVYV